jgi:tetratricopeptide (TPR) repeat protein
MSDHHLENALQWNPEAVCSLLKEKVPNPSVVSICSSVSGGYLPLVFRFIPDACFDFFTTGGVYPPQADDFMKSVVAMRQDEHYVPPLPQDLNGPLETARKYIRGCRLITLAQETEGLALIAEAVEENSLYKLGYIDLARAMETLGHYTKSYELLALYEQVNEGPSVLSMRQRAKLDLLTGKLSEADQLASQLILWNRDHINLALMGTVMEKQGKLEAAEQIYRESVAAYPFSSQNIYNLGVVLQKLNKSDAAEMYKQALELNPDLHQATYNLAIFQKDAGNTNAAITMMTRLCDKEPDVAMHAYKTAQLLLDLNRPSEALEYLQKADTLLPGQRDIHMALGKAYLAAGHPVQAAECYGKVLKQMPSYAPAHLELGYAMLSSGRPNEALKHLLYNQKIHPDSQRGMLAIGQAYHLRKEYDKALKEYRKLEQLSPNQQLTELIQAAESKRPPG